MTNVYQAISAVKADLGAVAKEKKMEAGPAKYQYRSIDDVLNKAHDALVSHGLVIAPNLRRVEQTAAGETRSGTKQTRTLVEFEYTIAGPEGDFFTAATVGEAIDSGDKGTNKAGTSAFKQLLTQLFQIPFETNDPDDTHTEVVQAPAAKAADRSKANSPKSGAAAGSGGSSSAPAPSANERTCPICTYAIGAADPIKKKSGVIHHKACLEGKSDATVSSDPNDISSIIAAFPGTEEQ